jgi:hypothetical protein
MVDHQPMVDHLNESKNSLKEFGWSTIW